MGGVSKVFSRRTLEKFEAAAASIPLRQLDRAFDGAGIRLGTDPGGPEGTRRAQFRRYVASVDQLDSRQLDRLGRALGALIDEVADSKVDFLVTVAEGDGFSFTDGVFTPAGTGSGSFAVARAEDLASVDDRGRRLHLLANDRPSDAIAGATELVESVCRTVLRLLGEPDPGKTAGLIDVAESTLAALQLASAGAGDAKKAAGLVSRFLQQLATIIAGLGDLPNANASRSRRKGTSDGLSPRHARLAVGVAVAFAGFVAETYVERAASSGSVRVTS